MNNIVKLLLGVIMIGLSSCASIPQATVEMSMMLGRQIEALEQGHVAMINAFYDEKEQTAIWWLKKVWYPDYLNGLFAMPGTAEFWDETMAEELPERMESLKKLTDLIQTDYMEQQDMLLNPLRKEREELLGIVRDHYAVAREMNSVITESVSSANAVQEKSRQLLSRFVDTDRIDAQIEGYLQRADSVLNTAQMALEKIDNNLK